MLRRPVNSGSQSGLFWRNSDSDDDVMDEAYSNADQM